MNWKDQIKIEPIKDNTGDLFIVNAARVSHNKWQTELSDKDPGLIKYLAKHEHMSPFRHPRHTFNLDDVNKQYILKLVYAMAADPFLAAGIVIEGNTMSISVLGMIQLIQQLKSEIPALAYRFAKFIWRNYPLTANAFGAIQPSNMTVPLTEVSGEGWFTNLSFRCTAPIWLTRQLVKHQVGMCLTGDTEVTFVKKANGMSNGLRTTKIKDIWRMWDGQIKYQGGEKGKRNIRGAHIRVFNETSQRFETSNITNVISCGEKDVFEITDEFGNNIKASQDHDFLTQRGWIKLKNLLVGDFLIRSDIGTSFGYTEELPRGLDKKIRNDFKEERANICNYCGASKDIETDHIIPVWVDPSKAKDKTNLQLLCKTCHRLKSSKERKCVTNLLPKYSKIVAIEYSGKEPCYDLSVDVIHNFMGNGFVVHNSWNEVSRRYVKDPIELFDQEFRFEAENVKQGSGAVAHKSKIPAIEIDSYLFDIEDVMTGLISWYNKCTDGTQYQPLAPETIRGYEPLNMMTTWIWSSPEPPLNHMERLRDEAHAQVEAQVFAQKMKAARTDLIA